MTWWLVESNLEILPFLKDKWRPPEQLCFMAGTIALKCYAGHCWVGWPTSLGAACPTCGLELVEREWMKGHE